MATIDLNADVGEELGDEAGLIPLVTSVNVACGGHAGDAASMRATVALALAAGAAIGAHPGYPDRAGFGRHELGLTPAEIEATVLAQVDALAGVVGHAGGRLTHVKAHGALYNRAAVDPDAAAAVASAVRRIDPGLAIVGLAGSIQLDVAVESGLRAVAEAFPDRAYEADGTLRARRHPDAVLTDSSDVAQRAVRMARDGAVVAVDGAVVALRADTLCLHGDTPGAVAHARAVRAALAGAGIEVRAHGR